MSIREPLTGVIFLLAQEQADEMSGVEPDEPGSPSVPSPESDGNPT